MAQLIDIAALASHFGTFYPPPYDAPCRARERKRLGDAAGLTQFGVNLLRLPPGVWSSQRHWHSHEDEFVYMLEGELVLVTDAGEEIMRPGDSAGFPAGSIQLTSQMPSRRLAEHLARFREGPRAAAAETGSAGSCAANQPKLGLLSDAENLNLSLRFKTLIVLTLRYQRAVNSRRRGFCDPPRQEPTARAAPYQNRAAAFIVIRPARSSRPRRQVDGGALDLRLGMGFSAFALAPCDGGHRVDRRIVLLHASGRQPAQAGGRRFGG